MSRAVIPGQATEIRYRRSGALAGRYYHRFKPGVRMLANRDGSVTLRGRREIHATEDQPGFWERYGRGRENPAKKLGAYQCQECGKRMGPRNTCPRCGSSDIDLAPLPGMRTGEGTPWRSFRGSTVPRHNPRRSARSRPMAVSQEEGFGLGWITFGLLFYLWATHKVDQFIPDQFEWPAGGLADILRPVETDPGVPGDEMWPW